MGIHKEAGNDPERSKPAVVLTMNGITPFQQMVSACTGAVLTSVFVTPLDVAKIRLQAQQKPFRRGQCFIYSNGLMDTVCICEANGIGPNGQTQIEVPNLKSQPWYSRRPCHFNGTVDAFIKIARYEGVASLWSGLSATLVMSVPATVVYFTVYDQLKYLIGYKESDPSTRFHPMAAGAMARVAAATLISPIELLRTKKQSEKLTWGEMWQGVKSAVRYSGFLSLMRGLIPTLCRDVPFSALYWFGYESMKSYTVKSTGNTEMKLHQTFAAGALSGTTAAVLTLPFDVIKTHRQIELGEAVFNQKETASKSMRHLLVTLYKQKGMSGLFAGIVPRVVKVAPACAVMISTYEYGKKFFRTHNANKNEGAT